MYSFIGILSSIPLRWWVILIFSALGIAAMCVRALETEEERAKRASKNKKKELQSLAERISAYAKVVHLRYPTGDIVVGEQDLAEQLRKRPDVVVTALNLLLNQGKAQRAALDGYWRLKV